MVYLSNGATLYTFEGLPINMRVGATFGATFWALDFIYLSLLNGKKTILNRILNITQWGIITIEWHYNLLKHNGKNGYASSLLTKFYQ